MSGDISNVGLEMEIFMVETFVCHSTSMGHFCPDEINSPAISLYMVNVNVNVSFIIKFLKIKFQNSFVIISVRP